MSLLSRRAFKNYREKSDEELLIVYREGGDPRVLTTLFQRYTHKVLGLCVNYLKNYQDGQDAAAEVFEHLCINLHRYQISKFEPWLYFVTRNHCLKILQRRLIPFHEDLQEISPDQFMEKPGAEDHYKEERLEQLSDAIEELKEDQRRCIVLFYLEQRSYKEISEMTNMDLSQVKSHIQNGKRNLKNTLMNQV